MRVLVTALAAGLALAACSNPKQAGDANFKRAIDAYGAMSRKCVVAPVSTLHPTGHENDGPFPAYVAMPSPSQSRAEFELESGRFEPLAAAGLVAARAAVIPTGSGTASLRVYELTDTGRKAMSMTAHNDFFGSSAQFCYATPKIEKIEQFTEPNGAMGMTVSEVSYTYRLRDVADWARSPALVAADPELKKIDEVMNGKAMLILTNHGWVDSRASKG